MVPTLEILRYARFVVICSKQSIAVYGNSCCVCCRVTSRVTVRPYKANIGGRYIPAPSWAGGHYQKWPKILPFCKLHVNIVFVSECDMTALDDIVSNKKLHYYLETAQIHSQFHSSLLSILIHLPPP